MGNPNVGIQGVNGASKLKRCLTDDAGRLLIGSAGSGITSLNILATTAPAYGVADNVGGEVAIAPAGAESLPSSPYRLDSIAISDPANQSANLLVMFFAASAAVLLNAVTDNVAFTWNTAARSAFLGAYEFQAADWKTVAGTGVATISNLGLFLKTDVNSSIYMVITCLGTPNFGNGFLYVKLGMTRLG